MSCASLTSRRPRLTRRQLGLLAGCLVLLGGLLLVYQFGSPRKGRGAEISGEAFGHGQGGNELPRGFPKKPEVGSAGAARTQVPLKMLDVMQVEAFDEKTGLFTRKILRLLGLSGAEDRAAGELLRQYLANFGEAEMSKAKVVVQGDESFIELGECVRESAAASKQFMDELASLLGTDRGSAVHRLVNKQLRHGGVDRMRIAFGAYEDSSNLVLIRTTLTKGGNVRSRIEGPVVVGGDFSPFARWRHLQKVIDNHR